MPWRPRQNEADKRIPEIAAVLLAGIIASVAWLVLERENAVSWVEHTLQVQTRIADLKSSLQKAESHNRTFLLTGDAAYLETSRANAAAVTAQLPVIRASTSDNAAQQKRFDDLTPLIQQRLQSLEVSAEQRLNAGLEAAASAVRNNGGGELMSAIESELNQFSKAETELLSARRTRADHTFRLLSIAATIGILVMIAAVATWSFSVRKFAADLRTSIAEREAAETQLRHMQKLEAIGQLTGGIAHDFNNMLAVVLSSLSLVQKKLTEKDEAVRKLIDAAADGATRAATLTSRLLAFSRQQPLDPKHIHPNKLVTSISDLARRTLGETIKIETVLGSGIWGIFADAGQLENAILNLCVNARDAMPNGGKLTIETENCHFDERYARINHMPAGQYVLIAVTDTGTGMSPEVAAKAFDPFFTTKVSGKGTGLGLSQVHGFVKQSGGHIKIYSEEGHGTTIKLYLPRDYKADDAAHAEEDVKIDVNQQPGANYTILVVEDDARVRASTVALLRELGFTVLHADGAINGLRVLEKNPQISVIFTDVVMPDMSGRQLADKALALRPDLQVVFTTGFTRNAIVHNGALDAGVEFIAKPFTLDQLALKMQHTILKLKKRKDENV
jgi:signal transduction histidine kinase/ActR/RegA family two-component response regulator